MLGIQFQLFLLLTGRLNKLALLWDHLLICKVDTLIPFISQAGGRDKMRKGNILSLGGDGVLIPTGQLLLLIMNIVNIDLLSLSFEVFLVNNQFEDLRKDPKFFLTFSVVFSYSPKDTFPSEKGMPTFLFLNFFPLICLIILQKI